MAIIRCENKHYYDNSKFKQCPHCKRNGAIEGGLGTNISSGGLGENKTVAMFLDRETEKKTVSFDNLKDDILTQNGELKTVGLFFQSKNMNPIAGWLVCIEGENKGRSFEIHIGKNFLGRSMKMDIHTNDELITNENHCAVIYEPISVRYYIVAGEGMTYCNGKIVSESAEIFEDDEISAGRSKYVFIPFCRKGRDWSE